MTLSLADALQQVLDDRIELPDALLQVDEENVETAAEAELVCRVLEATPVEPPGADDAASPLAAAVGLLQRVSSREAYDVLVERGLPRVIHVVDTLKENCNDWQTANDLLFFLKILAMYRTGAGVDRVISAARLPLQPEGFLWSVILQQFTEEHPESVRVMRELADPLPEGFIAIALLDAANRLALDGVEFPHPFDSDAGIRQLEQWLRSSDSDEYSYAHSTTAALPFLQHPGRASLLALALDHADVQVQLEGAWAAVKLGNAGGVPLLTRWCLDPQHGLTAAQYLEELGEEEAIPDEALEPEFQAKAQMYSWLCHPNEFGSPPDEFELVETRKLYWPPTDDERQMWLFRYRYEPQADGSEDLPGDDAGGESQEAEEGLGLVGSITFALFDEATIDLTPLEAYGLYCCWELECFEDARAPGERTVEAGLALLREYNSGLED